MARISTADAFEKTSGSGNLVSAIGLAAQLTSLWRALSSRPGKRVLGGLLVAGLIAGAFMCTSRRQASLPLAGDDSL
jgi:hypothetical protein